MASKGDYERLTEGGRIMGLEGKELRQFVVQQLKEEADERKRKMEIEAEGKRLQLEFEEKRRQADLEVEERRRKEELEDKRRQADVEEKRLQADLEEKRRQADLEIEERRRKDELEAKRMQLQFESDERRRRDELELERIKAEVELRRIEKEAEKENASCRSNSNNSLTSETHKFIKVDLPVLDEEKDDLDAYLIRFERTCEMYRVPNGDWAIQLARLLKGAALEVYQRMPVENLNDYDSLKFALLRRFQMTENGFRKRFRYSQRLPNETPEQFISRIRGYLVKWRVMGGFDNTAEGYETMMLKDQFFSTCSKELRMFLKEQGKMELKEVLKCAENYLDAHAEVTSVKGAGKTKSNQYVQKFDHGKESVKVDQPVNTDRGPKKTEEAKVKGLCYICGSTKHKMKDCDQKKTTADKGSVSCWNCGGPHKSFECPTKKKEFHKAGAMVIQRHQIGSIEETTETTEHHESTCHEGHLCNHQSLEHDVKLSCGCMLPVIASACSVTGCTKKHAVNPNALPIRPGFIDGKPVKVMRDCGCTTVVVQIDLLRPDQLTGQKEGCLLIDGVIKYYPTAIVDLDTPWYKGRVKALCMKKPIEEVIIGNIVGSRLPIAEDFEELSPTVSEQTISNAVRDDENQVERPSDGVIEKTAAIESKDQNESHVAGAVTTRAQADREKQQTKQLKVAELLVGDVSVEKLKEMQKRDESLKTYWELARQQDLKPSDVAFIIKNDLLYRKYCQKDGDRGRMQLMAPEQLREKIIEVAHDGLLSAHLGSKKTLERVTSNFYWRGVGDQVKRFCMSCDKCQRNVSKGQVFRAPLGKLPLIKTPFDAVCLDIIGPIVPVSDRNNRYILTLICMASRYPDAVALKNIDTVTVADALIEMYSRFGIPRRVHTDCGSQFTSDMMKEVNRLLSIKASTTTPYHAMGNGLVENLNKTVKSALKKMTSERPKDWDRYLAPLLFAIRDTPQASTGFSPFELIYGRNVRGPMTILRELWTNEIEEPEIKTTYQYVLDLREKIEETCQLAKVELAKVQSRNQKYYNRKAKVKNIKVGDKVLLLLPTDHNKLLLHWKGPFEVTELVGDVDYRIRFPTGKIKTFHANMLKRYYERQSENAQNINSEVQSLNIAAAIMPVIDDTAVEGEHEFVRDDRDGVLPLYNIHQKESYLDVQINPELSQCQQQQLRDLVREFASIFSDVPTVTNLIEHRIQLTSMEPVRCKMYPAPYKLQEVIDREVKDMSEMNIIERSNAGYSSPIVMVKKPDGSNRVCINFKALNAITVFDPEPMMSADDILPKLAGSKYYSKFDFSKGYWAIPMAEDCKDFTSFATSSGLQRFRVMPFGLVNAGSTYNRMMRKLLDGAQNIDNYMDDVLTHTTEWQSQLAVLRDFFERVEKANLSLKPSKCQLGYDKVEFLGYSLTGDTVEPKSAKIAQIIEAERPVTKKQVRSFLGMVNFYRRFIPSCATLAAPLSDLTRKGSSNIVQWGEKQEQAFYKLKQLLSQAPILKLPNINLPYCIQSDASNTGLGAVLLQEYEGIKHPVCYISRKLLPRECNYSVGEKECLAVVWAIHKLHRYIFGTTFTLETDHRPLECINKETANNSRIVRWKLMLNNYSFVVKYIKGSENVIADYLSRC